MTKVFIFESHHTISHCSVLYDNSLLFGFLTKFNVCFLSVINASTQTTPGDASSKGLVALYNWQNTDLLSKTLPLADIILLNTNWILTFAQKRVPVPGTVFPDIIRTNVENAVFRLNWY